MTLESEEDTVGRVETEALLEGEVPLLERRKAMFLLIFGSFPELSLLSLLLEASPSIVPLVLTLFLVELEPCLEIPRGGVVDPARRLSLGGDLDDLSGPTVMLLMEIPSSSSMVFVLDSLFSSSPSRANSIVIPFSVKRSASVLLGLLFLFMVTSEGKWFS